MPTTRYTVIYEDGDKRFKLCKILLTSNGSYAVTCPYHVSDRVSLMKRTINYVDVRKSEKPAPQEYAVLEDDEHRLKLSHHADGFVQFSGHGIISGRNNDGSPKGLGLVSWPLAHPTAGPAFSLSIQNPSAFKEAASIGLEDIVFRADELYRSVEDNGVIIESYYFPARWRRFVQTSRRGPMVVLKHPSGAILELRVCKSPADDWRVGFLGVDLWPCPVKFGEAESGFALSSPTGNLRYNRDKELEAEGLFAMHPAVDNVSIERMALAFPIRDDPPYIEGGPSPSDD